MNQFAINSIKGSLNVITGCGQGLGRATLKWFLQNDCGPVLCIDKKFSPDFEENLELTEEHRSKLTLKTHHTFDDSVEASLDEFASKHGTIDNLINVAGVSLAFILHSKTSTGVFDQEHIDNLLNYNTLGTFNVIRVASKYMVEGNLKESGASHQMRSKCIINTSCTSTTTPALGQTFYAGSKAALDSMTLCLARELAPFNIRCNTINVGLFQTKLITENGPKVLEYANKIGLCPQRVGQPEEFAHLVHKIIENQMINGACIKIDTGTRIPHTW